ncbi:MAG: nucleotidyltransferase domain-containing protein [Roseivirga sp.]|nr:nucleotidyltransferase domain-containing protein [Roseivirga sp.]
MIQKEFAIQATHILEKEPEVIGFAVGGSWLTNELDEFSDLDLILVTSERISGNKDKMLTYAQKLGTLLNGFTGEHVGEPRVLICLYDKPLLHVDIKFLTLDELTGRVETPHILLDKNDQLKQAFENSKAHFPYPDYQWIEDRFWIWVHYVLLKIGRGEYMEAVDFFGFMRMTVFGPLLHIKNGNQPRGVRKVETELTTVDFEGLKSTIPEYSRESTLEALENAIRLYKNLRSALFTEEVTLRSSTEQRVMDYFTEIAG